MGCIIKFSKFQEIHELRRQGLTIKAISEQLEIGENVVSRWLSKTEDDYWKSRSSGGFDRASRHEKGIILYLKNDPRISNTELLKIIQRQYPDFQISKPVWGKYLKVKRLEYNINPELKQKRNFTVHETGPGEEAQVDMGEKVVTNIYGNSVKIYIFAMVMSYSRMKFFTVSTKPFSSLDFVLEHDKAFQFFEGQPKIVAYDQDRTMVVSENAGKVIYTKEYEKYRQKMDFDIFLCHKSDPSSKGKIENVIKFIKYNFLKNYTFSGINKVNSDALKWLEEIGNGKINATTLRKPKDLFVLERPLLMPYKKYDVEPKRDMSTAKVTDLHTVLYRNNRYAVPLSVEPKTRVLIESVNGEVNIYSQDGEELLISHIELLGIGLTSTTKRVRPSHSEELNRTVGVLGESDSLTLFLERMCTEYPRYVVQQCRMLRKLPLIYTREQIEDALQKCLKERLYHVSELITKLIACHDTQIQRNS